MILLTDGDQFARRAAESAAHQLGLRCISASAGNPTPLSGAELIALIKQVPYDPVLVMVDDKGDPGCGPGEAAIRALCQDPELQVLGAVAVASNTKLAKGVPVTLSVDRDCQVVSGPVDKNGHPRSKRAPLQGDTVDILRELKLPILVGVGDPGKMDGADAQATGCEVTTQAIRMVLNHAQSKDLPTQR